MARQERALEQKARAGAEQRPSDDRGAQSAVKQGVDKRQPEARRGGTEERAALAALAARGVGGAAEGVAGDAEHEPVAATDAAIAARSRRARSATPPTRSIARRRRSRAIASARTRANSASGFAEMMQQLQEMAKKQGSINAQAQGLMGMPRPEQRRRARRSRARSRASSAASRSSSTRWATPPAATRGAARAGSAAARRRARRRTARRDDARAAAAALPPAARRRPLAREGRARGHQQARGDVGEGRRELHAGRHGATPRPPCKFRRRRWEELRGLLGRRASRDPRVLHAAEQCARAVGALRVARRGMLARSLLAPRVPRAPARSSGGAARGDAGARPRERGQVPRGGAALSRRAAHAADAAARCSDSSASTRSSG